MLLLLLTLLLLARAILSEFCISAKLSPGMLASSQTLLRLNKAPSCSIFCGKLNTTLQTL